MLAVNSQALVTRLTSIQSIIPSYHQQIANIANVAKFAKFASGKIDSGGRGLGG